MLERNGYSDISLAQVYIWGLSPLQFFCADTVLRSTVPDHQIFAFALSTALPIRVWKQRDRCSLSSLNLGSVSQMQRSVEYVIAGCWLVDFDKDSASKEPSIHDVTLSICSPTILVVSFRFAERWRDITTF